MDYHEILPTDWPQGCLVGRVWRPDVQGPSVVVVNDEAVLDISEKFPTMRDLCEAQKPAPSVAALSGQPIGTLDELLQNSPPDRRDARKPWLLAPIDLQAIKAAGVTFAVSLLGFDASFPFEGGWRLNLNADRTRWSRSWQLSGRRKLGMPVSEQVRQLYCGSR